MTHLCTVGADCRGLDVAGNQIPPRDVWDGGYLCGPCRKRLTRWVAELPSQYDDLALMLAVSGRPGENRRTEPTNLELNTAVADLRQHLRAVLWSWARVAVEERGVTAPMVDTVHAVCAWLGIHLDWFAHQPFASDLYGEVNDLRCRAWSLAHPSGRRRFVIKDPNGRPVRCHAAECAGTLHATIAAVDDLLPSEVACDTCDYTLPAERWIPVLVKGRVA